MQVKELPKSRNMEKQAPQKCPKCQQVTLYHNKGVSSKTNKAYENYKCAKCDYLQWIPQETVKKAWDETAKKPQSEMTGWQIMGEMQTEILAIVKSIKKTLDAQGFSEDDGEPEEFGKNGRFPG